MNNIFLCKQQQNCLLDSQHGQQFKNASNRSNNAARVHHFGLPDSSLIHRITALELNEEFDPYAYGGCTNHLLFKKCDFSKSAPSETQWLHGKINRFQAEERLKTFNQPGCYLVREKKDSHQTTFVLSYLDKKGSINHFQIKAICGDFYIAGEKFPSLKHLIGYYTKYVDLLKDERLVYPVPPIEKSYKEKPKFVAIVPYEKCPDTDELSFCKGDIFEVHSYSCQLRNSTQCGTTVRRHVGDDEFGAQDWLWATNLRTNESGLVYIRTVKELKYINDINEIYPWFITNITKKEADELLSKRGAGSWLIRPSDNSPGNYSLFFFVKNTVQRFRIERAGNSYVMGSRVFNSPEAVINLYKSDQIVAGYKLGDPITRFDINAGTTSSNNLSIASNSSLASTNMRSVFDTSGSISSSASTAFSSSMSCNSPCNASFQNTSNLLESNNGLNIEDIYDTLQASREHCQNQRLQQKMTAYLFKKSKKKKKWKLRFFVLNPEEQTLGFYENEKKIRPKGLIDLNYSYLYIVHESLFGKPYCFQLVEKTLPCISTMHFICAGDQEVYQSWIQALKPLCSPKQLLIQQPKLLSILDRKSLNQSPPSNEFATQIRTLYLNVYEARNLPVKIAPQPFFLLCLNKNKIARTPVKCPPDPIYEQEFILEEIPGDITNFSISLFNKGKHSKDTEIAEVVIELSSLGSEEIEDWFNLSNISVPGGISGSIRCKIRLLNELVMPIEKYQYFKKLIIDDDLEVISLLEEFSSKDRSLLSNSLLKIFIYEDKEAHLLSKMIEREVKKETETCTLFRSNSLTTNLMDKYMKEVCPSFINKALKESLVKIMENKHSCELNPQRLPRFEEACANAVHLLALLDEVVDRIFASVEHCPKNLRYICHCLQRSVMAKWPNDHLIRTQAVGSFIFLRLICPAILHPRSFNLIHDIPSENASRSLILIAKSLQNLSNLIEFGNKEAWMEIVNPFIVKNKSRMIKFIDDLASIKQIDQSQDKSMLNETARELAAIHTMCEMHEEKIFNLSQTCPTLKTLASVCQKLTEQKKRYPDYA